MIDKSFRELKKSTTLEVTQPYKKATMNREDLNKVDIKDLYDREDTIQKSIFYYNNEILNKVVDKMVRQPQKHKNPLVRDEESQYNAPPEGGQRGLATYSSTGRISFAPQNPLGVNDE
jgi:hypothetical protein